MANGKLFVGGISWNTDDVGLKQAFERFGAVRDAKVITDRETGRSRGFGFVTFEKEADAAAAISEMDGANLDGRSIRVNAAEDKARTSGGGPRGGRNDRGWDSPPVESRGYRSDRGGRNNSWG